MEGKALYCVVQYVQKPCYIYVFSVVFVWYLQVKWSGVTVYMVSCRTCDREVWVSPTQIITWEYHRVIWEFVMVTVALRWHYKIFMIPFIFSHLTLQTIKMRCEYTCPFWIADCCACPQKYRNPYNFGGRQNWRIFLGLTNGRSDVSALLFYRQRCSVQANSASHPFGVGKWVVIHVIAWLRRWRPLNGRPGLCAWLFSCEASPFVRA